MEKSDASTGGDPGLVVDTSSLSYQLGMITTKLDGLVEKIDRMNWRQDDAERRIEALENHKAERTKPNQWSDKITLGVLMLNLGLFAYMFRGLFS